jgi:hypothetical protein
MADAAHMYACVLTGLLIYLLSASLYEFFLYIKGIPELVYMYEETILLLIIWILLFVYYFKNNYYKKIIKNQRTKWEMLSKSKKILLIILDALLYVLAFSLHTFLAFKIRALQLI